MEAEGNKPNVSVFFPVYNDEKTVEIVFNKALRVLQESANRYEIIIVNDGSPDRSGEVADQLAEKYPEVARVIHHPKNLGYGAAVRTGLAQSKYEWICFTDGDDEYDISDLRKLLRLRQHYALIITFRYRRLYSKKRIVISRIYNLVLRLMFKTHFRDVSTGLRLINKSVLDELSLNSDSPFIGAEIAIKTMFKGYPVGEMGIQTFPTEFRTGASVSMKNIWATISDMRKVHRTIFSSTYESSREGSDL
jgi:glycosyltransferase involved in cell wall biosynthesis